MKNTNKKINELAVLTGKPIIFNKQCNNYNQIIYFYSTAMNGEGIEPYRRMDKIRMVSIIAKCIQTGKLQYQILDKAKQMLKNLGIDNI
ncbi:MAG: hypothetical protein EBU12_07920 [Microbacteriaceae bacterium]|nr:hypothetical protein [Microbacteriaceae bacterium]